MRSEQHVAEASILIRSKEVTSHRPGTWGMGLWLVAVLAWLLGAGLQIGEPSLQPLWVYQAGIALGGVLCVGAWVLNLMAVPTWAVWLRRGSVVVGLMAIAWGSTGWRAAWTMAEQWPADWQGRDVPMCVQVEGLPQKFDGGGGQFDARVLAVGDAACTGKPMDARAPVVSRVTLREQESDGFSGVTAGQTWRLVARLHTPDGLSNPGGYDTTMAPFERGVRAVGNVRGKTDPPVLLRQNPPWPWQGLVDRTRQRIRERIQERVTDGRAAGVLAGLAVGDQSGIERGDWDIFRRTGVAHLVSISGTHIAMLGWLLACLVRPLWSRWAWVTTRWPAPEVARWSAVVASLLYAELAGWGVPAQRTVLMMAMMVWLRSGTRRWPWPLVWLLSAWVVVVLDPWALRQAGFWLSYVAVGVLMSSGERVDDGLVQALAADDKQPIEPAGLQPVWRRAATWLWVSTHGAAREMARTQWLVTVALTPLALVIFQQVSVVGVGANLIAIPVFTLGITPLALAGTLWPPLWDMGAMLVQAMLAWLATLSSWSWAVLQGPALPWWVAVGAMVGAFALVLPVPVRWRALALPFFLPLWWLPADWRLITPPVPGQFSMLAADVGQGTAVLVRTAHHTLLFDAGPKVGTQSDAGERVLVPMLRAIGVAKLDTLLISHQDADHVGGAASVVSGLPVGMLLTSLADDHPLRQQVSMSGQTVPHQACEADQTWEWDEVRFTVLHPTARDYAQRSRLPHNALSCVLKVEAVVPATHGRQVESVDSVLLTADIEASQELALLVRAAEQPDGVSSLHSTVLMAPHHGSRTSSSRLFLQAVSPMVAVVQVGRRNRYGHPAPDVMGRYKEAGLTIKTSPECGAYLWFSGERHGRCWRETAAHYWYPADDAH